MLEKEIAEKGKGFEALNLIESLPGAGKSLAPAITAIVVNLEEGDDTGKQLRCMAGVAPVKDESGKRVKTVIRRRCNKRWRNIFHLFAWCSIRRSTWANAFYKLCRERGDTFATALRKLADKWIRIITCMIREKRPYDEKEYIESLRKGGSPIYERLCG
jgi:transposase